MFNCEGCHKTFGPQVSPIRVVTKTRIKEYRERYDKRKGIEDHGGVGTEIVKESNFCSECAILHRSSKED